MIVQPKFDDSSFWIRYKSWALVAAFTRSGKDVIEPATTIWNIPLVFLEDGISVSENPEEIRSELYAPNLSRTNSQLLAAGHMRKKKPTGHGLYFVAIKFMEVVQM